MENVRAREHRRETKNSASIPYCFKTFFGAVQNKGPGVSMAVPARKRKRQIGFGIHGSQKRSVLANASTVAGRPKASG